MKREKQQNKPTAPVIVARLSNSFGGRIALLFKVDKPYEHYAEEGEEIPDDAIESWQEVNLPTTESEDERIRKFLVKLAERCPENSTDFLGDVKKSDVLAYLEKQKEQKSAEWSEEDIKKIRSEEYTKGFNDAAFVSKLKEWSVEDEDRIRQIERIAQEAGCTQKLQEEIHDWLKSLRPQPKQEWSEEDKRALNNAIVALSMYANGEIPYLLPSQLLEDVERLKFSVLSLVGSPSRMKKG